VSEERIAELRAEAAKEWATLEADEDGEDLALALIRKAYGQGYVDALQERESA